MTVEAVCFDLDDTLYDYREYARAGLRAAADRIEERTGEALFDELAALYFDEAITEGTFDRLLERRDLDGVTVDGLVEAFHGAGTPLAPYPDAARALPRLADRYRLRVVTDGRGGRRKLARLGISGYFDAVVVTPELDCSKRHRRAFDEALATLEAPPGSAVYVGDDPRVDFRVPNDLGMRTVRVRRGRSADREPDGEAFAADEEIAALSDLLAVIG